MEECEVPALSEFETEEYRFRPAAIRRMELLVLSTLEWRMSVVTPFSYLNYFASWFQEHESKHLVRKAINLIFASIEGERDFVKMLNRALFLLKDSIFNAAMSLVDYRPSVIAAAAVLAVLDERLTQKSVESKMSTISSCSSLDTVSFIYKQHRILLHDLGA
ncbi:hypothetical protein Cni_G10374 [Canna indica]|uniref:Cyclin C-terminal domain-containing protein n=1 Tax=Canna indica TaxID=4628 RepID=A0AAQ3K488_9LILI|nr:hypothetical protein Cni_G10374 [Canna indica]